MGRGRGGRLRRGVLNHQYTTMDELRVSNVYILLCIHIDVFGKWLGSNFDARNQNRRCIAPVGGLLDPPRGYASHYNKKTPASTSSLYFIRANLIYINKK